MTKLKTIRTASGLSQSKLAEATGISVRTIQKYEQLERDINTAEAMNVYKIAQVLGCSMEDLLEK